MCTNVCFFFLKWHYYLSILFSFIFAVRGSVPISAFPSLSGILMSITSSTVVLNNCTITTGIKKRKSIIKKNNKKHDEIGFLAKAK